MRRKALRNIAVSIEVFARIWALRQPGEADENSVLSRLLGLPKQNGEEIIESEPTLISAPAEVSAHAARDANNKISNKEVLDMGVTTFGAGEISSHSSWWEVTYAAIERLGGEAQLHYIYKETERLCNEIGKRIPKTLDATVRGTLEDNCAESHRYKHVRDVFEMTKGRGQGVWGIKRC